MPESRYLPQLFRKRPVVIEAWHYPTYPTVHDNAFLHRWIADNGGATQVTEKGNAICTLEGFMLISPGDWIIRGVKGEFYPCKPDVFDAVFDATYEPTKDGKCQAVLTPNDLDYQCEKDAGHVDRGDLTHVSWRFSWRDSKGKSNQ